jgi:hypothetical protein
MVNLAKNIFELMPNDSHKSFYGKARVFEKDGNRVLFSYNTPVAYIDAAGTFHRTWAGWSATTGRHVAAFALAFSPIKRRIGKADWDKLPVEPVPVY